MMIGSARKHRRRICSSLHLSFERLEPRQLLSATPLDAIQAFPLWSTATPMAASVSPANSSGGSNSKSIAGFHPSDIAEAYGFNEFSSSRGRGQTIAIVSAFDDPYITQDLKTFDKAFNLPDPPSFSVVYARGIAPPVDAGWAVESAIDVEWAHAVAPGANIVLVEASTNFFLDLFQAVQVATQIPGVSVVSMSWGGPEFGSESFFDPLFTAAPNVTFVASSGDTGGQTSYPATSPYVVGVGGTTLKLDGHGNYKSEVPWTKGGGGPSAFYSEPSYQTSANLPGNQRSSPDISFNGDPVTGYSIYTTIVEPGFQPGWNVAGGTSASGPVAAGMFGIVNQQRVANHLPGLNTANADLYSIYSSKAYASAFHDIKTGSIGSPPVFNAGKGYDFATGIGTPRADVLIPLLSRIREGTSTPWPGTHDWQGDREADRFVGVMASPLVATRRTDAASADFNYSTSSGVVGAGFQTSVASAQLAAHLRHVPSALPASAANFNGGDRSPMADNPADYLDTADQIRKGHDVDVIDEALAGDFGCAISFASTSVRSRSHQIK
jgi:hypothetical protein